MVGGGILIEKSQSPKTHPKKKKKKKKRKFPWSKSVGLNRRSVPVVQIPPSHLGSFQLVAASPRGFGWGNASVTCRHKAGYVCASPCDIWKEEARCLVTYPHPPHPSMGRRPGPFGSLPASGRDHTLWHEASLQRVSIKTWGCDLLPPITCTCGAAATGFLWQRTVWATQWRVFFFSKKPSVLQ